MKKQFLTVSSVFITAALFTANFAHAQTNTPPATPAELEEAYTTSIESRTVNILKALALTDAAKSNQVHDLIIGQYRALRARDAVIDAKLRAAGKEVNYQNRLEDMKAASVKLHEDYLAKLSAVLTPDQVEQIKDKMTYNKVKVTFDAYVEMVSGLTDADKTKILEMLKAAREEAIDGGNAPEKSDIFQKYKDQINSFLTAGGHDVEKAIKDWQAKQDSAKTNDASGTKSSPLTK